MNIHQLFTQANALDYTQSNGMRLVPEMKGLGFFSGCIGTIKKDVPLQCKPLSNPILYKDTVSCFFALKNHGN